MKKVPASGETVKGIDISHWQRDIVWEHISLDFNFVFIKATEGVNYIDPAFFDHWDKANAHGITRGAYHFFHPNKDPFAQAELFAKTISPLRSGDLPPVMDWETSDGAPGIVCIHNASQFLNRLKELTGMRPIIYSNPYFLQALNLGEYFSDHMLWISHYGVDAPLVPNPWRTWNFWQTTDKYMDQNLFNGNLNQLKLLCKP